MRGPGNIYGTHRVLKPKGVFPQEAEKLDVSLPLYDTEILIRVDTLNIDSASFHQLLAMTPQQDPEAIKRYVLEIVQKRGKMHNPATNSGGTLLGTVQEVGQAVSGKGFQAGERITTLVSLSLTPLHLDAIESVDIPNEQLRVKGYGVLFESGLAHRMPQDMPEPLALAIFDVCGAPALVSHMTHVGETVVILGAGKAGVLAAAAARKKVGKGGHVVVLEKNEDAVRQAEKLSFVDGVFVADLTDPHGTRDLVSHVTQARMADLVVNCVNAPKTEMAAILAAKQSGKVLFFSMATSFQAAVLGAEGIGHETRLMMGNGYTPGHADMALNLVRDHEELRAWFERRFDGKMK